MRTLKRLMRELCEKGGAVFFSTHVLDVAEKLCDRVAIIKDGRLVAAVILLVSKLFSGILNRLMSVTATHRYRLGVMESRGLLKALYVREAKRYFSSSIYVTNTISLCVVGLDTITEVLPFAVDMPSILPFLFSAIFCMMTTSSTSVSMEGSQFWIIRSMPIPAKTLFDSKILMNLSLMLPFYLVSVIAMAIAVGPKSKALLWLLLIPAVMSLFSVVFGITVNLKLHSFDWEKEEAVVKQSASAMLGGFAGFFRERCFRRSGGFCAKRLWRARKAYGHIDAFGGNSDLVSEK